jgi:hypothetical protein
MTRRKDGVDGAISRGTPVEQCPSVQTSVWWPTPVDIRLNELVDRMTASGGEISRSQLLAVLVSSAPTNDAQLHELLRKYKRRSAGSIVLQRGTEIVPPPRRRGRRPR